MTLCRDHPEVIQIGLGKSGTSTVQKFFGDVGYNVTCGDSLAAVVQSAVDAREPLLERARRLCPRFYLGQLSSFYSPHETIQLQLTHLRELRLAAPRALFVHCERATANWVSSVKRWNNLRDRIAQRDLEGLPRGVGTRDADLGDWYEGVNSYLRFAFAHRPNYIAVDVDNAGSLRALEDYCGTTATPYNWTVVNANHANARRPAGPAYCGALDAAHSYRPMYTPLGVGFTRPPPRIAPLGEDETRLVPVMRLEDHHPVRFFYYADGCSDMFLRANRSTALLADDRVHAVALLSKSSAEAERVLSDYCWHWIERGAGTVLPRQMSHSSQVDATGVRATISGSGCLNEWLYMAMALRGLHTLLLNYESPGASSGSMHTRKIEVIHTGPLYAADGSVCRVRTLKGCYYCANSTRSLAMCAGRAHAWRLEHRGR